MFKKVCKSAEKESGFVPGQEVLSPGTRQDLKTLKVPWSRDNLVIGKVPGQFSNWESPGTMETLVYLSLMYVSKSNLGWFDQFDVS